MTALQTPAASRREHYVSVAGRVLLALIFVMSGLGKIPGWERTSGMMAQAGMPLVPLFLAGAIVLEIGGGLLLLTGWRPRWGAIALMIFLVPATFLFHNFWAYQGQEQQMQMISFLKNLSIFGGLLYVFATSGPGSPRVARQAAGS